MPIQFDPNSPIPDEFDPNPNAQGEEKMAPTTPPAQQVEQRPALQQPDNSSYGPGFSDVLEPAAKWIEENVDIPASDLIDNLFQGDQKTPEQISRERADKRTRFQVQMDAFSDASREDPAAEGVRAIAGGAADLVGIVNLPTEAVQWVTGKPLYTPINQGLINENNTTAGKALRTLSRYAFASLIPISQGPLALVLRLRVNALAKASYRTLQRELVMVLRIP